MNLTQQHREIAKNSHQIQLLDKVLKDVLPDYEISNPYQEMLTKKLNKEQLPYLPLILQVVKRLTILYHKNRIEIKKNYYEVSMEDITATLSLLQGKLSPLSMVREGTFYSYMKLKEADSFLFTRQQAVVITGYSKTQMQRILNELYQHHLLERTGSKNRGYYYQLAE